MALGWLKRLVGGGAGGGEGGKAGAEHPTETHDGFEITPAPLRKEGGWLTAGVIAKDVGGARREHRFIRADTHSSEDEAARFSVLKARQIIDEQGERIFREG